MDIWLSQSAKQELKSFSPEYIAGVDKAISLLEDYYYREQNKIDLCCEEDGYKAWALVVGRIWLSYHELADGEICVDWLSIRSKFRP